MKKYLLILLVVILLASATPVAAKGGGIRIVGEITAIDPDALTITVNSTTVQVTSDTDITLADGTCGDLDFDDLKVDDYVRVVGVYHGDYILAKRIIVQG